MATVADLLPGDLVTNSIESAVFIACTPHPLYSGLMFVTWRLADGSWSHDALSAAQEVGDVTPADFAARRERLRAALTGKDGT